MKQTESRLSLGRSSYWPSFLDKQGNPLLNFYQSFTQSHEASELQDSGEYLQLELDCRGCLSTHEETSFLGNQRERGKLGRLWKRELGKMEVSGNDFG